MEQRCIIHEQSTVSSNLRRLVASQIHKHEKINTDDSSYHDSTYSQPILAACTRKLSVTAQRLNRLQQLSYFK